MALRPVTFTRVVQPVRSLWQRFSVASMGVAAFALMLLGNVDNVIVERMRVGVTDILTPVLLVTARPAAMVSSGVEWVTRLYDLQGQVDHLREENRVLRQWWHRAVTLEQENERLRRLSRFVPPPSPASISARAITATGGPFMRSMLVSAGRRHGVEPGQVAVSGDGAVSGVVVTAGERHARVLLVTDLNSQIPVTVQGAGGTNYPGILSGDNSRTPVMRFLPHGAHVSTGDRVVTSGLGGVLPAGLPVGLVTSITGSEVRVRPLAQWSGPDHVRLLKYDIGKVPGVGP